MIHWVEKFWEKYCVKFSSFGERPKKAKFVKGHEIRYQIRHLNENMLAGIPKMD